MEVLGTDLAILRILSGNSEGALGEIQSISQGRPSPEFIRFAAEYFYDFGNPLRAAELFSRLGTVNSPVNGNFDALAREADALWLAAYPDSARNLWAISSSPSPENEINPRALYNLAVISENTGEAARLLERLVNLPAPASLADASFSDTKRSATGTSLADTSAADSRSFGLIRYSRLLNANQAAAALESRAPFLQHGFRGDSGNSVYTEGSVDALVDLELLRRRSENWETNRVVSETWLLLGRHPGDERLYQWAAWYFDFQRKTGEMAQLQKNAARNLSESPALRLHEALSLMRDGDLDAAEETLKKVTDTKFWPVNANLGRILEARHSPAAAINCYETASAGVTNPKTASRIQARIAVCLKTLGQDRESRRALEYALELDPDNLNARLELHRSQ
jgi:tetratricopeptide (TPR) repeat protein